MEKLINSTKYDCEFENSGEKEIYKVNGHIIEIEVVRGEVFVDGRSYTCMPSDVSPADTPRYCKWVDDTIDEILASF